MATFKAIVFSTKNHVKKDGTSNIKIRVYHNRDSQYIPTNFYISPDYLLDSGEVSDEWPGSDSLNFELGGLIQQYRKSVVQIGSFRLSKMTCKTLIKHIEIETNQKQDIIDFVKFSKEVIAKTNKIKTAKWYENSLTALIWYYGQEVIDTRDITSSRLNELIEQLKLKGRREKPLEPGAINNILRGIRALFNKCKLKYNDDDLGIIRIQHDPFQKVKLPKYKRKRKNIGIVELKKIRDGKYDNFRDQLGADVFLMMFYLMGININDLFNLQEPKFGRLEYQRSKTNTEDNINNFVLSIKIEPELQLIIDRYSSEGFLSDIKTRYSYIEYFNKAVNKGLKSICEDINIPKITTNWARHTFASIARNKAGVSKSDIDFCLGHVNNDYKMADIYIDIDYSIYDEVNRKVLDLLK